MKIPFTVDEFFHVFEVYNISIWPIQLLLYALAIGSVIMAFTGGPKLSQIVFFILSFFWIWSGSIYHIGHFSVINKGAYFFGIAFILQGILFFYVGVIRKKIEFKFTTRLAHILGVALILYSLLIYRVMGYYQGHVYPQSPTFGVPCPTTIFTFGILLVSMHRVPWYLIIIPLLWSLVGFFAAVNLSIKEDYGLVISGVLAAALLLFNKQKEFNGSRYKADQNQTVI
jgi:hypothetical protein